MISHSISQLSKTTRLSIITHLTRANQLVAGSLGVIMACPCMTLLAANPLLTPVDERFFVEKGAKESDFLSDLINHNTLTGRFPLVTPNDTNLIFAMNTGNEPDVNESQVQEQPQGAEAPQMQPLINLSLPPMSREQIAEIIRKLNSGLSEDTLTTLLNNIPEMPPGNNLTIASMIEQVKGSLQIDLDENQNAIMKTLSYILGTLSPVDLNNSQQQKSFAYLLVAYYAAINSSGASSQRAHVFFTSFLLHAAEVAGLSRLHWHKEVLLGKRKPIEDKNLLKENVAKSFSVFSGLKSFEIERIKLLQQLQNPLESGQPDNASVDGLLRDAVKLLNRDIDKCGIPKYERQRRSAEHMLELIRAYGGVRPELVAWGNQYLKLIDVISLMLDPFDHIRLIDLTAAIDNIEEYFRVSGKKTTFYNHEHITKNLFKEIRKGIVEIMIDLGDLEPESFLKLLVHIKNYICQELHVAFPDKNDYLAILATLTIGFKALVVQSIDLWQLLPDTTIGFIDSEQANEATYDEEVKLQKKELIKRLNDEVAKLEKRVLTKRMDSLNEFSKWLDYLIGWSTEVSEFDYQSESESSYTDSSDSSSYSDWDYFELDWD
ncbi:hypothetical protein [Endozoicomonas sp. 8E]|uniref:hypothetical protein n=1 Tax=Endozoicomonas sp. 8E TaxID=3035692 RepID=UPI002938DBFD|nr:hypothetical protein [Endozoicomonas sp. 8E]WOG30334.1 hypothetical protein P6910_12020 [Endozoicomonas sp. 8E]